MLILGQHRWFGDVPASGGRWTFDLQKIKAKALIVEQPTMLFNLVFGNLCSPCAF